MPIKLSQALIKRPSITPDDAGCQELIAKRLETLGFATRTMHFGAVRNLWATLGEGPVTICFAGHTDVVPTGPEARWPFPPFSAQIVDGKLHGRGSCDMKTALAAMVVATERFIASDERLPFRLAFLLTSDEEGPAIDGTCRALEQLHLDKEEITYCVVGEPSSEHTAVDTLKVGRRGSLHAHLTVHGVGGHVAYPDAVQNPLHALGPLVTDLIDTQWDRGTEQFLPTSFQIYKCMSDGGAENMVPSEAQLSMNWRFNPLSEPEALLARLETLLKKHALKYTLTHRISARPFFTPNDSPLITAMVKAVENICKQSPKLSTGGGTSDGRFFAPYGTHVIECGVDNSTIHKIGESIEICQIETLTEIYTEFLSIIAQKL